MACCIIFRSSPLLTNKQLSFFFSFFRRPMNIQPSSRSPGDTFHRTRRPNLGDDSLISVFFFHLVLMYTPFAKGWKSRESSDHVM